MLFYDKVPLRMARRKTDANGFVAVPAIITRVGIQRYTKDQLGIPGVSGDEIVNVFRGPDTVFHQDTIESFKHLPITDGHPAKGVSPKNVRMLQGGHIGEDVQKADESEIDLGATIYLTDHSFIEKSKGSETSAGYDAQIIPSSGEFEGQKYDYKFDGPMIGNHLALVPAARCGKECRVLDEENKEKEMDESKVQKMIDDAIKSNNAELTKSFGDTLSTALESHQKKVDEKAAEEKRKADEAAAAEKAKEDQKKNDEAAIQRRLDTMLKVKPLLGDKFDSSKSTKELLVMAFADQIEDAESKSEDYLLAHLDTEVARREKGGKHFSDTSATGAIDAVVVKPI